MALEKELATYQKALPNMFGSMGKFVLIQEEDVIDYFDSYEDALKAGYEKFGLEPFLVKKVQATEQVQFITRFVSPCPA